MPFIISFVFSYSYNGVCWDYSFWDKASNRCSSIEDYASITHPALCNQENVNCLDTYSNTRSYKYCPNSSSFDECTSKDYFFCRFSKTCILKCKEKYFGIKIDSKGLIIDYLNKYCIWKKYIIRGFMKESPKINIHSLNNIWIRIETI